MDITVVVIAYNEERNIRDCLVSLVAQVYTKGKFEIVVVDGMSQDHTPNIVEHFVQHHNFVRLLRNPGRTISSNRNVGIEHSMFPFIAFTDADCICPENWLENLSDGYQQLERSGVKIGAVGGGNTSDDQFGLVSAAIGIAFDTTLSALGSQQTRMWNKIKEVESLAGLNVIYAKSVFEEVGMFDESQKNIAEDWVLNFQLREYGYKLFYIPGASILHKMRTTLYAFVKQMYYYGLGRGVLIKKNKKTLSWRYSLPLLFFLFMTMSIPMYLLVENNLLLLPFVYFPMIFLYSIFICSWKNMRLIPIVMMIFLIIHFTYSFGEWKGLLKPGR